MAFDIYPNPTAPTIPQPVSAAVGGVPGSSGFIPIINEHKSLADILAGPDEFLRTVMFIRIAKVRTDCTMPPTGANPTIRLRITTDPTDMGVSLVPPPTIGTPSGSVTIPIVGGGSAADANITNEGNGLFLVQVVFRNPPGSFNWQLAIDNPDGSAHEFVWVVADTDDNARQPWIDVKVEATGAHTLTYDTVVNRDPAVVLPLQVINKGTGPLTISDVAGDSPAGGFTLVTVPSVIPANSCSEITMQFVGSAIGETAGIYTVASNDTLGTTGNPASMHNQSMSLTAVTRQFEVAFVLDASGSMEAKPDGTTATSPTDSRWSKLRSAVAPILELLDDHGNSTGRFGVAVFPNVTVTPAPVSSAGSVLAAPGYAEITSGNIENAIMQLMGLEPQWAGTPMGDGIAIAMGETAGSFGYYMGDSAALQYNRRWMVVMSDGAHNGGPPDPDYFFPTGTGHSFLEKRVKAITIGYGEPGSWEVEHTTLEQVATASGGQFLDAGIDDVGTDAYADGTGVTLTQAFRKALVEGMSLESTIDPGGILTGDHPEARYRIPVWSFDDKVSFIVSWSTYSEYRVNVQLMTPNCELLTPGSVDEEQGVRYHNGPRYTIYTVDRHYLSNHDGNGGAPRYGIWTLIISADGLYYEEDEPYEYEVITDSQLKLRVETDQVAYETGAPIQLTAIPTVRGKSLKNAVVTVRVKQPGQYAANWIALSHVTAEEYARSAEILTGREPNFWQIKAHALLEKGASFSISAQEYELSLERQGNSGIYTAVIKDTLVPGTYDLYVVATGETEERETYRREQRIQARVEVRPKRAFSPTTVVQRLLEEEQVFEATIQTTLRDPHGNYKLVDPAFDPKTIALTAEGAEVTKALTPNLDGSYESTIRYRPGSSPVIHLNVNGEEILPKQPLLPVAELFYVDRIIDFQLGEEAKPGANQYPDPKAALGDVSTKESFVALGGYGMLTVGFRDSQATIVAQGGDDVTVFIHPDTDFRRYRVEALSVSRDGEWITLGESAGVTASFSLAAAGVKRATAIRVTDLSGRVIDTSLQALSRPGVSVSGVGIKLVHTKKHWLYEESLRHVRGIEEEDLKILLALDIDMLGELSAWESREPEIEIPRWRRLDLRARVNLALDTADEFVALPGIEDWPLWQVARYSLESLMEETGATAAAVQRLAEQAGAFHLALNQEFLEQVTVGQMAKRTR